MNKADLVAKLESTLGSRKAATEAVEALVDIITRAVANGEKVAITGFGSFEKVARSARVGRNPRTGEKVSVTGKVVPYFKSGKEMRDRLNPKAGAARKG